MIRALQKGSPFALSRFDLPDAQELMVHSCEDCACPVTRNDADRHWIDTEVIEDTDLWIRGREVVEVRVDDEHQVLFNPLGRGGAVIVNRQAHQIYDSFRHPATFKDVRVAWPGDTGVELLEQAEANARADAATSARCESVLSMNEPPIMYLQSLVSMRPSRSLL